MLLASGKDDGFVPFAAATGGGVLPGVTGT
jgi:hypothetical protein